MRLITISAIFIIVLSLAVSADVISNRATEYHVTPRLDGMVQLMDEDVWTIGLWLGEYDAKNGYPKDPNYAITLTQRMDLQNDLEQVYLKLTKQSNKGQYMQAYRMGYERGDWEINLDNIQKTNVPPEVQSYIATTGFSSSYDYGYQRGHADALEDLPYDAIGYYKEVQAAGITKPHMARFAYTIKREKAEFFNGYRNAYYSYKFMPVPEVEVEAYNLEADDPEVEYARDLLPYADFDAYTIGTVVGWSDAKLGNGKRKTYMIDQLHNYRVTSVDYEQLYDLLAYNTGDYYVGYSYGYTMAS